MAFEMYTAQELKTYEPFDRKFQIDLDKLEKQCEEIRQKIKEEEGKVEPNPPKTQAQAKPSYAHTNSFDVLTNTKPSSPPRATDNRPLKQIPIAERKEVIKRKQAELQKLEKDLKKMLDDAKGKAGRKKRGQEQRA